MPEDFAQRISPDDLNRLVDFIARRARNKPPSRVRPRDDPRLRPRRVGALLHDRARRARHGADALRATSSPSGATSRSSPTAARSRAACTSRSSPPPPTSSTRSGAPASRPATATTARPAPRPQYGPDYYGGFLLDPDGNSVEAVHRRARRPRAGRDRPPVAAHRRRRGGQALLRDDRPHAGVGLGDDEPDRVQFIDATARRSRS